MSTELLLNSIPACRYCLDSNNQTDLLNPCRCSGSSKYVHKKCLKKWLTERTYQTEDSCELCQTSYNIKYAQIMRENMNCCQEFIIPLFSLTVMMVNCYLILGSVYILVVPERYILINASLGYWKTVLFNGFVFTHVLILCWFCFRLMTHLRETIVYCFGSGIYQGIGLFFLPFFLIFLTVFILHFDLLVFLVQKYRNKKLLIVDIYPYSNGREEGVENKNEI